MLTLGGIPDALAWIHFDVMALVTEEKGGGPNVRIDTTLDNNPGSKDLTWKKPSTGPGPTPGPTPELTPTPEPTTGALLALALAGLASKRRRR